MIKIEVTGTTLGEVSDKLLAIGARLRGQIVEPIAAAPDAGAPAEETKPKRAPRKKVEEPQGNATDAAPAVADEPSASDVEASPPAIEEEPELPMGDAPKELSLDHDVAPRILEFVKAKGREAMTAILDEFGVERASQIPPARWPELLEKLGDA
jgi:hypothetical protein